MSYVFRLALGLAAIDGLTSAFVATLILAFAVIGSGESQSSPDMSATVVLSLKKVMSDKSPMKIGLLAAIFKEPGAPMAVITHDVGGSTLSPIPTASQLTKGGSVLWFDCISDSDSCSSQ